MADSLLLWEADPFFPAAEEVQNSTDRMESIYRTWKYTEGLARSSPEDAGIVSATEMNKRDLMTALDTVRWQLEEFEKAVGLASAGEDARSRHLQFVQAIYSQIDRVQMEVGDFIPKYKDASTEDADRECLALFLSGSELDRPLPRVRVATVAQAQAAESSDEDDADAELPTVSPRVNGSQRVNGYAHYGPSSSPKYDDDADGSSWWSRLGLWPTLRAKQQQYGFARLQLSDSGLKRWKDGDDGSFLECICALKERCMGDIEQGTVGRNGMCRKACSPPRSMDELSNSSSSSSSNSSVFQRRLQGPQQAIPFWNALQVAGAVLAVVLLMCLYFWFLSTLVPFDHIPGNSLS